MNRLRQRGMTMVELLVAMFIGVGVTLVVATLLVAGENHKRTTTSTNDADQTGAYAFYALEKYLRSAGSAIAESAYVSSSSADAGVLGCKLNVAGILPAASFPAPFAGVLGGAASTLRVAPVLIASGQSAGGSAGASDVLIIMSGAGTGGGISRPVVAAGSISSGTASLQIESAEGFQPKDYVLLSQSGLAAPADCLLEEVTAAQSPTAPTPPLPVQAAANSAYPYYTATGTATTLATLVGSTSTYVTGLGNVLANDLQYQMIGVGSPDTLYSYDLLQYQKLALGQNIGNVSQAIADGVVAMYAIYGVSTTASGPGVFGEWVSPGDVGTYDISTVMNSANSEPLMKSIVAVRVSLIVRGEYYDKNIVSPSSLSVFSGLTDGISSASLTKTVNLTPTQQHYRYRTFEFTVPLRNMLILAGTS